MAASDQGLDPQFDAKIQAMIAASNGRLHIESGYRDNALQAKLYNAAVQKYGAAGASKWVAPPGHSNHNRGLAVDLGGDIGLAHQLAPQFGLEFPMSWEPWHVEPLGLREHSGTSQQAYTAGPPGTLNPTQDPSLNSQPATLFARLASALSGAGVASVAGTGSAPTDGTAGALGPVGPQGPQGSVAVPAATGGQGAVDPKALYAQLKAQGLDSTHAAALVAIAGRESGYNPTAHNGNAKTGDNSYGLFQINLLGGMHSQFNPSMLSTTGGSVQAAADLVKAGGLQPWGGYKGVAWSRGTNLQAAADASGGEVTVQQLQGLK